MKIRGLLILAIVFAISPAFAKGKGKRHAIEELSTEIKQVMLLTDLTSKISKELLEGRHPQVAVECKEGTHLPLKYLFNMGAFSIKLDPNLSLKVEKACYIRILSNKKGYVSFDLENWEKPNIKLLDTQVGLSQDKSHILLETSEHPDYRLD